MTDLSRATKSEQAWYRLGLAEGQAAAGVTAATTSGWRTSEFWLCAAVVAFGLWSGWLMMREPELDMERWLAVTGGIAGLAGYYTKRRSDIKQEATATAAGGREAGG